MATKKAEYFKFNEDGNVWDLYYFKTSADLIAETNDRKVLTSDERTKISNFLTTFNTANKLVQVESGGKIPTSVIPTLPYLSTSGGTVNGTIYTSNIQPISQGSLLLGNTGAGLVIIRSDGVEIGNGEAIITLSGSSTTVRGDIDMNYYNIGELPSPTKSTHAVNKEYVDNKVSSGFTTKAPVKSASTANVDITAVLNALDGFTLSANDRVLLKNQTSTPENGVYQLDSTKKPVMVDNDSAVGSAVFVENGDTNNDYIYHCSTANSWVAFSKPDTIKAGDGLTKSGTTLYIGSGAITSDMIDYLDVDQIDNFESYDITDAWSYITDASSHLSLKSHLSNLFSAIKLLRGTTNYNTNNTQTIAGAYTAISTVQNNIDTVAGTIPKITSGTSNPSTTGAKNGDLYFKELS